VLAGTSANALAFGWGPHVLWGRGFAKAPHEITVGEGFCEKPSLYHSPSLSSFLCRPSRVMPSVTAVRVLLPL
jgi:hypothetical protein